MGLLKSITISAILATSLFAKVDFREFGDICDSNKVCQNSSKEIKAIQLLLKKRFGAKLEVNGKLDSKTKKSIIAFQKLHGIKATGYVGAQTKSALNLLLYGKELPAKKQTKKVIAKKVVTKKTTIKKVATKKVASRKSKAKLTQKKLTKKQKLAKKQKERLQKNIIELRRKLRAKMSSVLSAKKSTKPRSYKEFLQSVNLRKSFAIYKDPKLIKIAKYANTHIKVDVSEQRVKLVVNGKVALDAPCTTGSSRKLEPNSGVIRDKHTPYGTFRILEKVAVKRSTIFGSIYKNGKLVYKGDRRKYTGSWKGAVFVGHPLKKWMRLTSGGIGLHASKYIKRYPASNGCIRLPESVANTLFASIKKGTKVKVVY